MALKTGKLPLDLLEEVIAWHGAEDADVVLGPAVGEDAAAVALDDGYLILKADPITFAEEEVGWYAVQINANDVATRGAAPRWFQASVLFPAGTTANDVRRVFRQVHEACRELGVAVTGGHAEVTTSVNRTVVAGSMHGLVAPSDLVTTGGARQGDDILLTKSAGIEGTALLARDRRDELLPELGEALVGRAMAFLRDPGLSVVPEALRAAQMGATSLHDPTEGGVAMGVYELSRASEHEVIVRPAAIPVAEETRRICGFYGLNPLGLLGSGALLVTMPPGRAAPLLSSLRTLGVPAVTIGQMGGPGVGLQVRGEAPFPLDPSERDEIVRVLGG